MIRRAISISSRASVYAVFIGAALTIARSALAEEAVALPLRESIQKQTTEVFNKSRSAVVRIEATDSQGRIAGTGFFMCPNGTLYTCYSVGGETRDLSVAFEGKRHPATRLVADLRSGLAILKIEARTPFLTPGSSRELAPASPVMVVGYPMDLPLAPSFGLIAGFDMRHLGRLFATTHIRANIPIQRGEGGAPLLNLRGEVVGMLTASLDDGSAAFAVPIEATEKVRCDYLRFQKVRRGWLGIQIGTLETPIEGSTAGVRDLLPGSPGLKAGLRRGDVLLQVGRHAITSPEDVINASFYLTADDEIPLRVHREGQQMDLRAQPIDPPEVKPGATLPRLAPGSPGSDELHLEAPPEKR